MSAAARYDNAPRQYTWLSLYYRNLGNIIIEIFPIRGPFFIQSKLPFSFPEFYVFFYA